MRRPTLASCLICLGIVAAACGGSDDAADTISLQPSEEVAASSTEVGAETSTTVEAPTSTTTTTAPAGQEDLERMALELADMPAGWSESIPEEQDDDGGEFCVEDAADLIDTSSWPRVDKEFSAGALGPLLTHNLIAAPSEDLAIDVVAQFSALAERCQQWTDDEGSYELAPVNYPEFGDETFAVRLLADTDGFAIVGDIIVLREGNVLALVFPVSVGNPVEADTVVGWLQTLDDRD